VGVGGLRVLDDPLVFDRGNSVLVGASIDENGRGETRGQRNLGYRVLVVSFKRETIWYLVA